MFLETKKEGECAGAPHPVPSFGDLIAWLEMQPPEQKYYWPSIEGCLVCIYYKDRQIKGGSAWYRNDGPFFGYEDAFIGENFIERISAYQSICSVRPWTFGAALKRARVALPKAE